MYAAPSHLIRSTSGLRTNNPLGPAAEMRFRRLLPHAIVVYHAVGAVAWGDQQPLISEPSGAATPILTPDFSEFVQRLIENGKIPGLTVAVVRKDGPTELGAWGIKSEEGAAMTSDTLFSIASCSKAFVSASLGILIDDFAHGRNVTPLPTGLSSLTWKSKLADILPHDWKLSDPWASGSANLIDILSHVSGTAGHDLAIKQTDTVLDVTRNLRNFRPSFELREKWYYNNQMYMVGAHIVSTLSGTRYVDFVKERISNPLKMNHTTYSVGKAVKTGKATETWTSFGRLIPRWLTEDSIDLTAGPGGLISNVEELALWVRTFLNDGVNPATGKPIIPTAAFNTITSAQSIMKGSTFGDPELSIVGYGLGWTRFSYLGHDVIQHSGSSPGVSALITAALSDGVGIVVLANADEKDQPLTNISFMIARRAFGIAEPPPSKSHASRAPGQSQPTGEEFQSRPTPADTSSQVDLRGTYHNIGYGTSELCSVNSTSNHCRAVLDNFRSFDEALTQHTPDLFAAWDTIMTTHARFTPINGGHEILIGSIYPKGYGKDTSPFTTLRPVAFAEFVVEGERVIGFGIRGITDARTGGIEEAADVWFVKQR
ncbi:beta-lactamase/transpeptidase-like protein [Gloeopeniophorella convolvens]|nr:beta-lactamase/transpeptidase-like protein [Gloeopeniophorella convolvens]